LTRSTNEEIERGEPERKRSRWNIGQ
jgi:hypothetical protein